MQVIKVEHDTHDVDAPEDVRKLKWCKLGIFSSVQMLQKRKRFGPELQYR
jgi:hypothetical protein